MEPIKEQENQDDIKDIIEVLSDDETTAATIDEVRNYDFKHPKLVSKEIMRILHNIHDELARNLTRILSNALGLRVEIMVWEIDQVVISEYLNSIDAPSVLYLFKIDEYDDWALMEIDPGFCMFLIERQSGSDDELIGPRRGMTRIEEKILSRTINKILNELSQAWSSHIGFTIKQFTYESKPENIHTIPAVEPALVVELQVIVGDQPVTMNICYPYELLKDPMNNSFYKSDRKVPKESLSPDQVQEYEKHLKNVMVPIQALLGQTKITVKELIQLEDGDIIKLDQQIDEPLLINIKQKGLITGYPGALNGKRAVKIFDINEELKKGIDGTEV